MAGFTLYTQLLLITIIPVLTPDDCLRKVQTDLLSTLLVEALADIHTPKPPPTYQSGEPYTRRSICRPWTYTYTTPLSAYIYDVSAGRICRRQTLYSPRAFDLLGVAENN